MTGPTPAGPVRISVVVPAYNEERYLAATLTSLAAQDYRYGHEVIVVDNGSTDATASIAASFAAEQAGGLLVRVVVEPRIGVCAARQRGTESARGAIVVSTDADTTHPPDWLTHLDAQFADGVVAVAGPCRYADPPGWGAVLPPLGFAAVALGARIFGTVGYLTATNVAFRADSFPGYDLALHQGGDEVDLLRRLRRRGRVVWDPRIVVTTSSRRIERGLGPLLLTFGFRYAAALLVNRLLRRTVIGPAPAVR